MSSASCSTTTPVPLLRREIHPISLLHPVLPNHLGCTGWLWSLLVRLGPSPFHRPALEWPYRFPSPENRSDDSLLDRLIVLLLPTDFTGLPTQDLSAYRHYPGSSWSGLFFLSLFFSIYLIDPAHISSISLRLKWRRLLLIRRMF